MERHRPPMVLHPPRARDGCAAPTAACRKALLDRSGCGWLPLSRCRTRSFLNFTVGVVGGNCWLAHRLRKAVRRPDIAPDREFVGHTHLPPNFAQGFIPFAGGCANAAVTPKATIHTSGPASMHARGRRVERGKSIARKRLSAAVVFQKGNLVHESVSRNCIAR